MRIGGGNSKIFYVHPEPWSFMIQFDEHMFSNGLVQPLTSMCQDTWILSRFFFTVYRGKSP